MKTLSIIILAGILAGCGNDGSTVKAIEAFYAGCAKPVSAELRLGPWGNELLLRCEESKPLIKNKQVAP